MFTLNKQLPAVLTLLAGVDTDTVNTRSVVEVQTGTEGGFGFKLRFKVKRKQELEKLTNTSQEHLPPPTPPPPLTSGRYLVLEISSDVIPQPGVCKSTRRRLDFLFPFSSVFIHFPGTLQTLWFDVIEIIHSLVLVSCSRPMVNVLYIYFPVTTYRLRCC